MADDLTSVHHLAVLLVHLEDAPAAERDAVLDGLFALRRLVWWGRYSADLLPRQFMTVDRHEAQGRARRAVAALRKTAA